VCGARENVDVVAVLVAAELVHLLLFDERCRVREGIEERNETIKLFRQTDYRQKIEIPKMKKLKITKSQRTDGPAKLGRHNAIALEVKLLPVGVLVQAVVVEDLRLHVRRKTN
jgi:hypothetical protein